MHSKQHLNIVSALCAALTGILAWVVVPVPFSLVPVSGQTLGVMIAGILLPPRYAAFSQSIYLALGVIGLPIFAAGGSGPGIILGPTGGYLWSFVIAAWLISKGIRLTDSRIWQLVMLILGGVGIIYLFGTLQLMLVAELTLTQALLSGMAPFILGDALKVVLAWVLAQRLTSIIPNS